MEVLDPKHNHKTNTSKDKKIITISLVSSKRTLKYSKITKMSTDT